MEDPFRSLFANAASDIYQSTVDRLLSANPSLATLFGYDTPQAMVLSVRKGSLHDFNNTLAATLMHLGQLRQNPELTATTQESLRELEDETTRAASLSRKFLLFSHHPMARLQPVELNGLIHERLKTLTQLLGQSIRLAIQKSPSRLWAHADPVMLEQLLMSLCLEARTAMPEGGELGLASTLVESGAVPSSHHPDARSGNFVCLSVEATGRGLAEMRWKQLRELVVTGEDVEKETQLGLAAVREIVRQHQGWIEAGSVAGRSIGLRIFIPAAIPQAQTSPTAERPDEIKGGNETILFVEDDAKVRQPTALCLRKLGYAVLEACNGAEALKIWERNHEGISLLFTDMEMPNEITGLELAHRFKKARTSLKVILSSGNSVDLTGSWPTLLIGGAFLAKPYSPPTVACAVRRCLDEGKQT